MSGRTARARRREKPRLVDADALFAKACDELMRDMGIGLDSYTEEEIRSLAVACCAENAAIWDEFCLWVGAGEDKRERTSLLMQAMRERDRLAVPRAWRP